MIKPHKFRVKARDLQRANAKRKLTRGTLVLSLTIFILKAVNINSFVIDIEIK